MSLQAQGWKVCIHMFFLRHACSAYIIWALIHTRPHQGITRILQTLLQIIPQLPIQCKYTTQTSTCHISTMAVGIFTILAGLIALAAGYFYLFGISPEMKRKMEKQALKTMGENKMSYMAKGASAILTAPLAAWAILTPLRLHQQDSLLRPRRRQEPEEWH